MATVRFVTVLRVTAGCVTLALAVIGCADGGDDAASPTTLAERTTTSTTAPQRPASTTTTAYDPAAVEGQVEAAYLRSWDVYADAVYNLRLDEAALTEVYAGEALELRRTEIQRRRAEGRASFVRVDHHYEVVISDETSADVVDNFVNHQVLIDPSTKEAVEPDPNEPLLVRFRLVKLDGQWRVTFIEKINT